MPVAAAKATTTAQTEQKRSPGSSRSSDPRAGRRSSSTDRFLRPHTFLYWGVGLRQVPPGPYFVYSPTIARRTVRIVLSEIGVLCRDHDRRTNQPRHETSPVKGKRRTAEV